MSIGQSILDKRNSSDVLNRKVEKNIKKHGQFQVERSANNSEANLPKAVQDLKKLIDDLQVLNKTVSEVEASAGKAYFRIESRQNSEEENNLAKINSTEIQRLIILSQMLSCIFYRYFRNKMFGLYITKITHPRRSEIEKLIDVLKTFRNPTKNVRQNLDDFIGLNFSEINNELAELIAFIFI